MSVARQSKSSTFAAGRHRTNAPWSSPRRATTGAAPGVCGLAGDATGAGDEGTHGSGVLKPLALPVAAAPESASPVAAVLRAGDDRSAGATLMAAIEDASMPTSSPSLADTVTAVDAAPSIAVSPSLAAGALGDAASLPGGAMARRSCLEEERARLSCTAPVYYLYSRLTQQRAVRRDEPSTRARSSSRAGAAARVVLRRARAGERAVGGAPGTAELLEGGALRGSAAHREHAVRAARRARRAVVAPHTRTGGREATGPRTPSFG